ncbi:hypothetical protein Tsubulata_050564 [Turnera subulata]|uniref:Uncharacterized protein n=1 Tax=Turnera subulata TaxID=218843 RepID=A0A9Q0J424_9ROSI|nr:hypothetical protein Tsubulata_050564 [Turnera subulata]
MGHSEEKNSAVMDFVVNKLGWGLSVFAQYPVLFGLSLEKRFIPRDSVIQFLLSRDLIEKKCYTPRVFKLTDAGDNTNNSEEEFGTVEEAAARSERIRALYEQAVEDQFDTEEEKASYDKYMQELCETGGYGITTSFGSMVFGVIVPFDLSGPYESSIERMKKFCKMGLDENVPGLEFVDLVHACTGHEERLVFYITFTVRDPSTPSELRAFQFKYCFYREKIVEFQPIQNVNPKIVEYERANKSRATEQLVAPAN